jgi:hypothetical protein
LLNDSQSVESKNNKQDLYRGFVSVLNEGMFTRFDYMQRNIDLSEPKSEIMNQRNAIESARRDFEKGVSRNDNLLPGQRAMANAALQQEVILLQKNFQEVTEKYQSKFGQANRDFVDSLNRSRVELKFNDKGPAWDSLSIEEKQARFSPDGKVEALIGMSFEKAVRRIGGALQASDLSFEVGQPHRTDVSVARVQAEMAQDRLAKGETLSPAELLRVQEDAIRAVRSVVSSEKIPAVVGLVAALPASPSSIRSVLLQSATVVDPFANLASPIERIQALANKFGRDFKQAWANTTGAFKFVPTTVYAIKQAVQGGLSDTQRVSLLFNAYADAPDLVSSQLISTMTEKYPAAVAFVLGGRGIQRFRERASEAQRQQVAEQLEKARVTALTATQKTPDFTVARERKGASETLTVSLKQSSAKAANQIAALAQLPSDTRMPITVRLVGNAIKDNQFVADIKNQVHVATLRGADFYWGLADGRAVRLGVRGGRNNAEAVRGTLSRTAKLQLTAAKLRAKLPHPVAKLQAKATQLKASLQKPVAKPKPTFAPGDLTPFPGAYPLVSHETSVTVMAGLGAFGILSAVLAAVGVVSISAAVVAAGVMTLAGTAWMYFTRPITLTPQAAEMKPAAASNVIEMPIRASKPSLVQRMTRSPLGRVAVLLPPMMLITGVLSAKGAELGTSLGAGLNAMSAAIIAPLGISSGGWATIGIIVAGLIGVIYTLHLRLKKQGTDLTTVLTNA